MPTKKIMLSFILSIRPIRILVVLVFTTMLLAACTRPDEDAPLKAVEYRANLETLAKARVFFAHQSVGRNLLQGLTELAAEAKVPLKVARMEGRLADTGPGVFHVDIGKNKEPLGKIKAFAEELRQNASPGFDVALLKFCYLDLSAEGMTDPHALVEEYSRAVSALRASYPNLRIVHVTSPLRSDPVEWKTPIKRLLGRDTYEDADNRLRNAYNMELRKRFAGEVIFDIAEVESTLPQGTRSAFGSGTHTVFTLAQAYTSDGGHLNARGRQYVAAAFTNAVAAALRQK